MKKFYDTCALLNAGERAFAEPFYISMVTLRELENIKTSRSKDAEVKHKARKVTPTAGRSPRDVHGSKLRYRGSRALPAHYMMVRRTISSAMTRCRLVQLNRLYS